MNWFIALAPPAVSAMPVIVSSMRIQSIPADPAGVAMTNPAAAVSTTNALSLALESSRYSPMRLRFSARSAVAIAFASVSVAIGDCEVRHIVYVAV